MFNKLPKSDLCVNNLRKSAQSPIRDGLRHADRIYKIRVNPCESVVKSIRSLYAFCQNQSQSVLICGKSFHFVNFFMQNEPNFKKVEIALTPSMTNGYVKFYPLCQPKNEAKTNPNKPNFLLIWVIWPKNLLCFFYC